MDRATLQHSLAALAAELDAIERQRFAAGFRALSARSQAKADEDCDDDPAVRVSAAGRRARAERHDAEAAKLAEFQEGLHRVGTALGKDDAAWGAERRTYDSLMDRALAASRTVVVPPDPIEAPTAPLLSECMESYVKSVAKNGRGVSYVNGLRSKLAEFISLVGDKPLTGYVPRDLRTFAEGLADLPAHWMKLRSYEGRTASEVVAMVTAARNRGEKVPPCRSETSIRGYCWTVATAFQWLAVEHNIRSPFVGMRVKAPEHAPKAVTREPFAVTELNRWFANAVLEDRPDDYWLPLLGTLTGARIGELAFLQGGDITEVRDGLWVADLSRCLMVGGKERERQVKNEGSRRLLALHHALTDVGFVRYAKARKDSEWVFPHLHHKVKDPADTASKRQGARLRAYGLHSRLSAVFHSSRHTAKDFLRIAKVDPRTSSLQTGHAFKTVEESYGSKRLRTDEIEVLAAMDLPEALDLSPYLSTKGPMQLRPIRRRKVLATRHSGGE